MTCCDFLKTPIGYLHIHGSTKGVTEVLFHDGPMKCIQPNHHTISCKQQLMEYFAGNRKSFSVDIEQSGTHFQEAVWQVLRQVPYGQSASYSDIANSIQNPKAVRAVGAANGNNKIAIIIPCHRIIGRNNTLTGYAGGLERKAWLLKHEGIMFLR